MPAVCACESCPMSPYLDHQYEPRICSLPQSLSRVAVCRAIGLSIVSQRTLLTSTLDCDIPQEASYNLGTSRGLGPGLDIEDSPIIMQVALGKRNRAIDTLQIAKVICTVFRTLVDVTPCTCTNLVAHVPFSCMSACISSASRRAVRLLRRISGP